MTRRKDQTLKEETSRTALTELDMNYVCRNVRGKGSTKEALLLKSGGNAQVPFLVDTDRDVRMYESDNIVEYLNKHYG